MAKTKTVSDEIIVSALLQNSTVEKAAEAAGVSPRTIYSRMREREFRGLYSQAKAEMLRSAVVKMNGKLSAAVDEIAEIMTDKGVNPSVRLQAAQTILNNAGKYNELLAAAERTANIDSEPVDERIIDLFSNF